MLSFYIRHNSVIDLSFKITLLQLTPRTQDLEEPETATQVGPTAAEGPHHRVLFTAGDADKSDAAADEANSTEDAPGDRSERIEEGSEAVDAGRTESIHVQRSRMILASIHH